MTFDPFPSFAARAAALLLAFAALPTTTVLAQSSDSNPSKNQTSSSQGIQQEKAPSLIDPAGPTVSLVPSESVFVMAAALNACGYDEGKENSAPVRQHVRDEMNQAFAKSEEARQK